MRCAFFVFCLTLSAQVLASGAFVGSDNCGSCHTEQHTQWQGSHHDLAMETPTEQSVLGDFNQATFTHRDVVTTFFRKDAAWFIRTAGEDGKLADFPVRYTFGAYPLQQYLLPLSRGRLQAFEIAWDARPAAEGGQRWFHLNPDEVTDHTDPLHWTGPYMNWNTRCAECHSTNVEKRYDARTRSFDTRFSEVDVSCEACHGPGEAHLKRVADGSVSSVAGGGFPVALQQRGDWAFNEGAAIASRLEPLTENTQIDNCGRCHSRRGTLGDYHYGKPLLDTHRLALPETPLYYHDGQIRDEVFVYGSWVQSKMHQAGVVCSNCHEPHSLQLRAPGNGVCAQCHQAAVYDQPEHHHHPEGSSGASCANCHMPETTYMVVDPRRDHSMRIPRPDLSVTMGVPNACNQCHVDQTADWALAAVRDWGVNFTDSGSHPARALQRLHAGQAQAVPDVQALAADGSATPIMRATALAALGQTGGGASPEAQALLESPDPLLRLGAVRGASGLPLPQRYSLLQPLISDDITSVRMAVAENLAAVPLAQVPPAQADALRSLFAEYIAIQSLHADMPGVQLQMGMFLLNRGDLPAAEKAYREALQLNPQLLPARLNLADLLRMLQREDEARAELQAALAIAPDNGAALHALGLLETRSGNRALALEYLRRAAEQEEEGTRHRYVYAIALYDSGDITQAITTLEAVQRQAPGNADILLALTNYTASSGDLERARYWAQQLVASDPGNRNYRALLGRLGGPTR
ncbi:tetratricopeptide repeat protein [Haliea sp.]|uniref:tetratricopeptide repeat protein n=1 Tax=Haliea sp. TaxID=1932666 RepID=UPI0035288519